MLTLAFIELPSNILLISAIVLITGIVLTIIAASREHAFWKEFLRDIGIACIIAVVVTILYEAHIRTVLETGNIGHVLSTVMKHNVPHKVWEEVDNNVFKGSVIRRNVKIDFEIQPHKELAKERRALLLIKYGYDLYRLKPNSAEVAVQHNIVNDYKDHARFEHVLITDSRNTVIKEYKRPNEQEKKKEFREIIHLDLGYNFQNNMYLDWNAVRVESKRYEVINLPGSYPLGMPVIIEGTEEKPIYVSVTVPANSKIEPSVDTQWGEHTFRFVGRQGNRYVWTYKGIILPGQFFNVLVSDPVTPP